MTPTLPAATPRYRPQFTLDALLLEWVSQNTGAGDCFVSEGHAVEMGLARLRAEQAFIRDRCKREAVLYRAEAFWRLYQAAIDESLPPRVGRPRRGEKQAPQVERRFVGAFVAKDLGDWMAEAVHAGHFSTTSHVAETGLRNLRAQHLENRIAGEGFPFDGETLWNKYQGLLGKGA